VAVSEEEGVDMNDLQQIIINEAIDLYEKQFFKWLSIEEYRRCLENQYTPMEFMACVLE